MRWFQLRIVRRALALFLLFCLLLIADAICYQVTLPVSIHEQNGFTTLAVGSTTLALGAVGTPTRLQFAAADPVVHEYQLDGSDSTNNFTLNQMYLDKIASSPYYLFQAWMRDLDGSSSWRNLRLQATNQLLNTISQPGSATVLSLPPSTWRLSLDLQRPETPRTLELQMSNKSVIKITLDRNDRYIRVIQSSPGQLDKQLATAFFPTDIAPFAAMVIDLLIRTLLWAIVLLVIVLLCESFFALINVLLSRPSLLPFSPVLFLPVVREAASGNTSIANRKNSVFSHTSTAVLPIEERGATPFPGREAVFLDVLSSASSPIHTASSDTLYTALEIQASDTLSSAPSDKNKVHSQERTWSLMDRIVLAIWRAWHRLTASIHPVGLLALFGSFCFVCWIALVQYNAEPHIYDTSAYLFAAKTYALGRISVPMPPAADRFPGAFMVQFAGRWFTQYPPGTGLTLAPGVWLGVPWLVEPLLGTLALLGTGLIAARMYDRRVATLAVLLGTLSPFYSYIAASYLSHAIAFFYLIWGLWATLRFFKDGARWYLPVAALFFGMGILTRDLLGLLFAVLALLGVCLLSARQIIRERRQIVQRWRSWLLPVIGFIAIVIFFTALNFSFNASLTGNMNVTPRNLFFGADKWGFGQNIGFYGQHTVAAGLVNIDEIITILAIDLYGWPFYLTLAFLALPFLTLRARAFDWFLLVCTMLIMGAFIGYFYHGIYLGPRYVFETLPFLLMLTARGIFILAECANALRRMVLGWVQPRHIIQTSRNLSLATILLVLLLIICNLFYYLPRQITLYQNYSGIAGDKINLPAVYHSALQHAIVVTDDITLYQLVLFPLNDPLLHNNVIYAVAVNTMDYQELHSAFPGRTLYKINVTPDGAISYALLAGPYR